MISDIIRFMPMFLFILLLVYLPFKIGFGKGFTKGRYKDKFMIGHLDDKLIELQYKKDRLTDEIKNYEERFGGELDG